MNLNLPMPRGTDWAQYAQAFAKAREKIDAFGPDVLLISLGLDTFHSTTRSRGFCLTSEDYLRLGEAIAAFKLPTLFVFEGGYNVEMLGFEHGQCAGGICGSSSTLPLREG